MTKPTGCTVREVEIAEKARQRALKRRLEIMRRQVRARLAGMDETPCARHALAEGARQADATWRKIGDTKGRQVVAGHSDQHGNAQRIRKDHPPTRKAIRAGDPTFEPIASADPTPQQKRLERVQRVLGGLVKIVPGKVLKVRWNDGEVEELGVAAPYLADLISRELVELVNVVEIARAAAQLVAGGNRKKVKAVVSIQ